MQLRGPDYSFLGVATSSPCPDFIGWCGTGGSCIKRMGSCIALLNIQKRSDAVIRMDISFVALF